MDHQEFLRRSIDKWDGRSATLHGETVVIHSCGVDSRNYGYVLIHCRKPFKIYFPELMGMLGNKAWVAKFTQLRKTHRARENESWNGQYEVEEW